MGSRVEAAERPWKKVELRIAVITAAVGLIAAFAVYAFNFGFAQAKAEGKVQSATLRVENSKGQAELMIERARTSDLRTQLAAWQNAHKEGLAEIERQRIEMKVLLDRLGKLGNCTFIHERILALQQEIDHPGIRVIGTSGEEVSEKNLQLRQSLAGYKQLLASCQ